MTDNLPEDQRGIIENLLRENLHIKFKSAVNGKSADC